MYKLNSKEALFEHKKLINKKGVLKKLYDDFYLIFKNSKYPKGEIVEIGSGGGFLKKIIPQVITSDVVRGSGIKEVFSAEKMPFKNSSVAAFTMLNVFHHIKNPEKALNEIQRCLKPNGKIIMIEPYNSLWGRFIYQNFHHELFDPKTDWKIKGRGRLSDANGALAWIVFIRDKKIFNKRFPNLIIKTVKPHTPFRYLISGGLSKPQLLPSFFYPAIKLLEQLLSPINPLLGMFATIELEKIKPPSRKQKPHG